VDAQEQIAGFDVGNTSTKGAFLSDRGVELVLCVPTPPVETLAARLADGLRASGRALAPGAQAVASSVCPEANAALREFWRAVGAGGGLRFFGADLPVRIPTLVREPAWVGTDRLLCALGARKVAGPPCVVVGAGTAITVDLVDAQGRFAGGAITPGFALSALALHEGTSCLPLIEPSAPAAAVGLDTAEAIRSGIYHSCRGGVAALIEGMKAQAGGAIRVVVTGGDAPLLLPLEVGAPVVHVPELIFIGMSAALQRPTQ